MATVAGGAGQPTELEERLAHVFAAKFDGGGEDTTLELLDDPPAGAGPAAVGLEALRVLLDWIRALITNRRCADARDLTLPQDLMAPGINVPQLAARADGAVTALDAAIAALNAALTAPIPVENDLRAALAQAAQAGAQGAVPRFVQAGGTGSGEAALKVLVEQGQAVLAARKAARARIQALEDAFARAAAAQLPAELVATTHHVDRIKGVFGEGFPVMPLFTTPNAAELNASLGDRPALCGGDDLAPRAWLQQMAPVRPGADTLAAVLTAAELLGTPTSPGSLQIAQLPHAPGQRWAALPFPDGTPPSAQVAMVAVGDFNPAQPNAGLVVDAWDEIIPGPVETTGLAFHYDAPGARAPQAVLLAVPPDRTERTWSFEALVETVLEAAGLFRLRAVGLKQMRILTGGMLPAVYLPQNFTKDEPSVNLFKIAQKYPGRLEALKILGRG